jgi:hypothetical protein
MRKIAASDRVYAFRKVESGLNIGAEEIHRWNFVERGVARGVDSRPPMSLRRTSGTASAPMSVVCLTRLDIDVTESR